MPNQKKGTFQIKECENRTWDDIILEFKVEFPFGSDTDAELKFENHNQFCTELIREYFYKLKLIAHEADALLR